MNAPNVYIVGGGYEYWNMFKSMGFASVTSVEDADIICFTGGEDVSPSLYGECKHPTTFFNPHRDSREKLVFQEALENQVPMVGICRGGQFLNVMSGGKMFQHVGEHTTSHTITDIRTGRKVLASSTHHQMMRMGPGGILIASARLDGFKEWMDGWEIVQTYDDLDTEVVHYPLTQCLCFQPHPEFTNSQYAALKDYFFDLIDELLLPFKE